jgi:hypothetical protein
MTTGAQTPASGADLIPSTLEQTNALSFWLAILLTGVATGLGAPALTRLLEVV